MFKKLKRIKDDEMVAYYQGADNLKQEVEDLRSLVDETRKDLYKTLERLNRKFDLTQGKKSP